VVHGFLLSRRVQNCTAAACLHVQPRAVRGYWRCAEVADATAPLVQRYLSDLRQRMAPVSVHQHYRCPGSSSLMNRTTNVAEGVVHTTSVPVLLIGTA